MNSRNREMVNKRKNHTDTHPKIKKYQMKNSPHGFISSLDTTKKKKIRKPKDKSIEIIHTKRQI